MKLRKKTQLHIDEIQVYSDCLSCDCDCGSGTRSSAFYNDYKTIQITYADDSPA